MYEYTLGSARARIVVLSAAPFNPRRATYAVVLGADVPTPAATVAVACGAGDPVRGTVDVSRLRPLVPEAVGARVGWMSHATMRRVDVALRTYLGGWGEPPATHQIYN